MCDSILFILMDPLTEEEITQILLLESEHQTIEDEYKKNLEKAKRQSRIEDEYKRNLEEAKRQPRIGEQEHKQELPILQAFYAKVRGLVPETNIQRVGITSNDKQNLYRDIKFEDVNRCVEETKNRVEGNSVLLLKPFQQYKPPKPNTILKKIIKNVSEYDPRVLHVMYTEELKTLVKKLILYIVSNYMPKTFFLYQEFVENNEVNKPKYALKDKFKSFLVELYVDYKEPTDLILKFSRLLKVLYLYEADVIKDGKNRTTEYDADAINKYERWFYKNVVKHVRTYKNRTYDLNINKRNGMYDVLAGSDLNLTGLDLFINLYSLSDDLIDDDVFIEKQTINIAEAKNSKPKGEEETKEEGRQAEYKYTQYIKF